MADTFTPAEIEQICGKAEDAIRSEVLMLVAVTGRIELIAKVDKLTTMIASKALTAGLSEMARIGKLTEVKD